MPKAQSKKRWRPFFVRNSTPQTATVTPYCRSTTCPCDHCERLCKREKLMSEMESNEQGGGTEAPSASDVVIDDVIVID